MTKPTREQIDAQIDQNFIAFEAMKFHSCNNGKFALLRNGELVDIMADGIDAHKLAERLFDDGLYSIQEIDPMPARFGAMSHALVDRHAK